MYTIFKNDTSIILTDDRNNIGSQDCYLWIDFNRKEVLDKLISNGRPKLYFYDTDLDGMWRSFKGLFKVMEASGGIVRNEKDDILFIYRNDKWDLPKGKIEGNETIEKTAIREVTEETGVNGLEIIKPLETTYHIFKRNGKHRIKVTYWFEMKTNFDGHLYAQEAEGITKVEWLNKEQTTEALENSYANIRGLI